MPANAALLPPTSPLLSPSLVCPAPSLFSFTSFFSLVVLLRRLVSLSIAVPLFPPPLLLSLSPLFFRRVRRLSGDSAHAHPPTIRPNPLLALPFSPQRFSPLPSPVFLLSERSVRVRCPYPCREACTAVSATATLFLVPREKAVPVVHGGGAFSG